jgi:hypothetical protein
MPAQAYQLEPIFAYTESAAQSFGGSFGKPWGALGGMTRSLNLPNMSVHSRCGEQSHSQTLSPSTTRLVETASHGRKQPVTYGVLIF